MAIDTPRVAPTPTTELLDGLSADELVFEELLQVDGAGEAVGDLPTVLQTEGSTLALQDWASCKASFCVMFRAFNILGLLKT